MNALVRRVLGKAQAPSKQPESPSGSDEQGEAPHNMQLETLLTLRNKAKSRISHRSVNSFPTDSVHPTEERPLKAYEVSGPETNTAINVKKSRLTIGIIRVSHSFRIKWDLFVMALALWNVFCVPFTLVFNPEFGNRPEIMTVNLTIDAMFIVDIVLNFRTSFYAASTGDEILTPALIAKNYLVGKFWIDALTAIPSELVDSFYTERSDEVSARSVLALFGMLKLYRISRLNRIISYMRARSDVKLGIRILQLVLFLFTYVHLLACGWWVVARYDETWKPASGDSTVYEKDMWTLYWTAFYGAVTMLGGGEMNPMTTLQLAFCSIMIICATFINAVMFGSMAVLLSNLNMRQTQFQETQNLVNTAMKNMRLPENLQQRISDYLIYTEATMTGSKEFETFKALVSPSLYNEVLQCIYGQLIKDNPIVVSDPSIRDYIIPKLTPLFCEPEEVLIRQHEEARSLFFLARGNCQVLISDELQRERSVGTLKPGLHFGEIGLLTNGVRTATVRSMNYCTLAVLDKEDFQGLLEQWPASRTLFKRRMFQYHDRYKRFLLRMIRRVPQFKGLNVRTEQELVYSLKLERVEEGDYLVRPGGTPERLWLLAEGELEVSFTLSDRDLNTRRAALYRVPIDARYAHKSEWNLHTAVVDSALKKFTDIYPLWGPMGLEGALHATELDSVDGKTLLGRNCVELELETLHIGSVVGQFSLLSSEPFSMQVRALTKATCYVLEKSAIQRLRKICSDLHEVLCDFEAWSRDYTPYVDDYYAANDSDREFQLEFNKHKGKYRFKGAILRAIKDNRDKKVMNTPMLAAMLGGAQVSRVRRASVLQERADNVFVRKLLAHSFKPETCQKLHIKESPKVESEVIRLVSHFEEQQSLIRELGSRISLLSTSLTAQHAPAEQLYSTAVFQPNRD